MYGLIIQALMKMLTSHPCVRISKTSTRMNQKPRYGLFLIFLFQCYISFVVDVDLCCLLFQYAFVLKLNWTEIVVLYSIIHQCSKIFI